MERRFGLIYFARVRQGMPDRPTVSKITILLRGDAIAALSEDNAPLRVESRTVLTTKHRGGVITLARSWMGKRVLVVELPEERPASRGK